jgi:hypothetical protein
MKPPVAEATGDLGAGKEWGEVVEIFYSPAAAALTF